jgi:Zn-dependent peptidase ImmA (M78 family)
MPANARQRALASASMQATRLHRDLNLDVTQQVDVFGIAQTLGLWLMAQPLDHLYGFYLRTDEAAGIVVNSQHPESLQRFTVAHEIGHHVLGHQHTTDDIDDLASFGGRKLEEAQAQAFAASLLLPLPLINRVLRNLPQEHPLTPGDVYLFSRQTGVSYTAAVWQLKNLKKLTPQSARQFAKLGAAAAKSELRGRSWTSNARADVWVLGPGQAGLDLACRVGDEVHVRLPENLSTGHAWHIDEPPASSFMSAEEAPSPLAWISDTITVMTAEDGPGSKIEAHDNDGLKLEADEHVAYDGATLSEYQEVSDDLGADDMFGDFDNSISDSEPGSWSVRPERTGTRVLVFVPRTPGGHQIRLTLRPIWDPAITPLADYRIGINARIRARIDGSGIVQPTRDAWASLRAAS